MKDDELELEKGSRVIDRAIQRLQKHGSPEAYYRHQVREKFLAAQEAFRRCDEKQKVGTLYPGDDDLLEMCVKLRSLFMDQQCGLIRHFGEKEVAILEQQIDLKNRRFEHLRLAYLTMAEYLDYHRVI